MYALNLSLIKCTASAITIFSGAALVRDIINYIRQMMAELMAPIQSEIKMVDKLFAQIGNCCQLSMRNIVNFPLILEINSNLYITYRGYYITVDTSDQINYRIIVSDESGGSDEGNILDNIIEIKNIILTTQRYKFATMVRIIW